MGSFNVALFLLFIILICIIALIIINKIAHCIEGTKYSGGSNHKPNLGEEAPMSTTAPSMGEAAPTSSDLYAMSYTISGEANGLNYSILRQLFKKNGDDNGITWVEKPVLEKKVNVSFGTFGGFSNKKSNNLNLSPDFYKQSASIKNVLDGHSGFINKTELYATIKRLIPNGIKYIPATYTIKEFILQKSLLTSQNSFSKIFPKGVAILKKNYSCQQQGVRVIESMEDYYKSKKELDIKEDGAISEYITNPLTIEGKKFHLRIYFLLSVISGITRCSVYHEYRIRTAVLPYKKGDWLNPDIHITGGHTTGIRYLYPDDICKMESISKPGQNIDKSEFEQALSPFLDVVCMALASSGVKNYSESNAGYQLYGADVLITEELIPILIEINKHPGFSQYGSNEGWLEYSNNFSTNLFHFILTNVVFSYFGLCRQPNSMAAFIGNGILSQFGEILLKCTLIPIAYANESEIATAKQMHFYDIISYEAVYKECFPYNVFLIGYSKSDANSRDVIIGFIGITFDSYIKIAIIEEYQNRGIATAMIAAIMEIQYARHYTSHHIPIIKIKKRNGYLTKIAVKLHFILNNRKKEFERKCRINDPIIKKINNGQLLTYKIIDNDNNTKEYSDEVNSFVEFISLPHMTPSSSQFVHLVYSVFNSDRTDSKFSTGNRYNKTFIYQGAELKSALFSKTVAHVSLFKKYIYENVNNFEQYNIFDKKIDKKDCIQNALYNICDEHSSLQIVKGSELLDNTIFIEEYNPPFLIDNKLVILKCSIIIYISGNNIIKYFVFNEKKIYIEKNNYNTNTFIGDFHINFNKTYKFPDDFKTGELSEIANNADILDHFIQNLIQVINCIDYNLLKPYSESNSGFLGITAHIKFIHKNNKWHPILNNIWNYSIVKQRQINNIKKYYDWIQNCAIAPHFGFHHHYVEPVLCSIRNPISKDLDSSLIAELSLQFNQNRDSIDVLQSGKKISIIDLNISHNIIELKKINIGDAKLILNIIFVLMDILAAYYAPNTPQLIFLPLNSKETHQNWQNYVAFELQFFKGHPFDDKTEYFIKKCR